MSRYCKLAENATSP